MWNKQNMQFSLKNKSFSFLDRFKTIFRPKTIKLDTI